MTFRDALYFSYAGIKSIEHGIYNVNLSGGMQEEPFAASRSINEISTTGRDRPYFQNIQKEPLSFSLSFAFKDAWNEQKIIEVTRWLTEQDYYQELYFTNDFGRNPEKIYYALVVDDPSIVHNCLRQGYINLKMRTNSAYAYSPLHLTKEYQWKDEKINIIKSNFVGGKHYQTIVNSSGYIILNPTSPRWIDDPTGETWLD